MEDIAANIDIEAWVPVVTEYAISYGTSIVGALLIFFIGKWIAKRLVNVVGKLMNRANVDKTLVIFTKNIVSAILMTFIVIAALSSVGIQTASLAAVIAAAGLAVGLALQGSLSNFASGVMIILFRPFKADDFIEAAGVSGTVKDVSIFTTTLNTADNKVIIVPNGSITGGVITNYSRESKRRVDFTFGISYDDDIRKAKDLLLSLLSQDSRIHQDPAPFVAVSELGDNSVNLVVRVWTDAANYWDVNFETIEKVKLEFDKNNISFPFPQRDVHVIGNINADKKAA